MWRSIRLIGIGSIVGILAIFGGATGGPQVVPIAVAQPLPIQHVIVIMQENPSFDSYRTEDLKRDRVWRHRFEELTTVWDLDQ